MNRSTNFLPVNALQLVSIQFELLMAVGLDLKLDAMLYIFMQKCLARLGLRSIHIYNFYKDSTESIDTKKHTKYFGHVEHFSSIPQDHNFHPHNIDSVNKAMTQLFQRDIESPVTIESNETHYILFHLDGFGILILDKLTLPKLISIPLTIHPLIERLTSACNACIEHENITNEIAARNYAEKAYELLAKQDQLTNLPNRRMFQLRLFQEISRSRRHEDIGSVIFIDLDNFKNINDSLGHSIGDALLTEVAHRLQIQGRAEDEAFRIGGDEFALILKSIGPTRTKAAQISQEIAERLRNQISKPIVIKGQTLYITPSIGIALYPITQTDDENVSLHCEEIVQNADIALYHSKKRGKDCYAFYEQSMQEETLRHQTIETNLRSAIENNELTLNYQPLVDTHEMIIGAEALLRWKNPVLGNVSPEEFIAIAEESGLILKIGEWALKSACTFIKETLLISELPKNFYISVNISQKQFNQENFVTKVKEIINQAGISPKVIKLEITENMFINNIDSVINKMKELSVFGVEFLLDDFGTGYSSLSNIQRLPVRTIKIDKTFITDIISQSDANKAITNAIISLADHICLDCIVEGVETKEDAEHFKLMNIHAMQGYYYYRPLTKNDFIKTLNQTTNTNYNKLKII